MRPSRIVSSVSLGIFPLPGVRTSDDGIVLVCQQQTKHDRVLRSAMLQQQPEWCEDVPLSGEPYSEETLAGTDQERPLETILVFLCMQCEYFFDNLTHTLSECADTAV